MLWFIQFYELIPLNDSVVASLIFSELQLLD